MNSGEQYSSNKNNNENNKSNQISWREGCNKGIRNNTIYSGSTIQQQRTFGWAVS